MKFTAGQIAGILEGEVQGNPEIAVHKLAKIEEGEEGSLTFLANPKYTSFIYTTNASITIVNKSFVPEQNLKTTLIKVICDQLGVKENTSSPTFSIVNEYQSDKGDTIFHFDFYRLKKETEAYDMGVEEYFESGLYCFVEWPERIPTLYPTHYFKVRIMEETNSTRIIEYSLL